MTSNEVEQKLFLALYRGLIVLRKENKAFCQTNLNFIHENHQSESTGLSTMVFTRKSSI